MELSKKQNTMRRIMWIACDMVYLELNK